MKQDKEVQLNNIMCVIDHSILAHSKLKELDFNREYLPPSDEDVSRELLDNKIYHRLLKQTAERIYEILRPKNLTR